MSNKLLLLEDELLSAESAGEATPKLMSRSPIKNAGSFK
jgi:hypothetical protein